MSNANVTVDGDRVEPDDEPVIIKVTEGPTIELRYCERCPERWWLTSDDATAGP